jgi:hypothetical protein
MDVQTAYDILRFDISTMDLFHTKKNLYIDQFIDCTVY